MPECRIRVLEPEVAAQIAAGEVVERPASVVKELVENSLDSGGTRVLVELEDAGRTLIRVADNGCGMTPQEAVLALQRHATSKISRAEDLTAVQSLGFRGEALPSIASVSEMSLLTRARGESTGVRLEATAGEILALDPAGSAEGTVLSVRHLFFNTPARLKFLKSDRTELSQVCDVLTRLALARPDVSIRLLVDGQELLHAPGSTDPSNGLTALFGANLARELVDVEGDFPLVQVAGFASRLPFARPTRSGFYLYVNGRSVRNRTLIHAVDEAYRGQLPPGRFPFVVLQLTMDPALVDVNVHPNKTEVRFLRDWDVHRAVQDALRKSLDFESPRRSAAEVERVPQHQLSTRAWVHPGDGGIPPSSGGAGTIRVPAPTSEPIGPGVADPFDPPPFSDADAPPTSSPAHVEHPPTAVPSSDSPASTTLQGALFPRADRIASIRVIAQLWNSYILAEDSTGLLLIDQHLAHERALYDDFSAAASRGSLEVRALEPPLTIAVPPEFAVASAALLESLNTLGFRLEPFGKNCVVARGVPTATPTGREAQVIRDVLDSLNAADRAGGDGPQVLDRVAASIACRGAVKKGTPLSPIESAQILALLQSSGAATTCPHGCTIVVRIPFDELLRRFKRI